ncbi:PREDICTED: nucleosome assembly protein 1;3-like [Camelina sativa]|uniref:Nucleosome assembly protein 13-like n=1 Tax=Camelina sativa TaxID=90675 RepID=A0ABM1Q715_CAMSA|nr:PREDICTED: nucleosome assembly protein 1;3-like [Camelina sativa]
MVWKPKSVEKKPEPIKQKESINEVSSPHTNQDKEKKNLDGKEEVVKQCLKSKSNHSCSNGEIVLTNRFKGLEVEVIRIKMELSSEKLIGKSAKTAAKIEKNVRRYDIVNGATDVERAPEDTKIDQGDEKTAEACFVLRCFQGTATEIDWYPSKCLTQKILKKKPKKGAKNAKPITKNEDSESFFNFFNPHQVPDDDEDIDEDSV